ncbi:MAG: hypothetical protein FJ100_19480 [Deltaproteobacteria bacterium]|nr:hypothetical protein [Deltaproteobacteria bacterium]
MVKLPNRMAVAAAFVGTMALLAIGTTLYIDTRAPGHLASTRLQALQAGDTATLRTRVDLGLVDDTETQIRALGTAELEERRKAWDDVLEIFRERYKEARKTVIAAGEEKLSALPYAQQTAVREASRNEYHFEKGKGDLSAAEAAVFASAASLFDEASETTVLPKLVPLATGTTGYPTPEAALLRQIRDKVRRAGGQAEEKLSSDERMTIKLRSRRAFVAREGWPKLNAQDQAVFGPAMDLVVGDNDEAMVERAAKSRLSAGRLAEFEEALKAVKGNKEDEFVDAHGTRLLNARLVAAFKAVACTVGKVDRRGATYRSVLRSAVAIADVDCDGDVESLHRAAPGFAKDGPSKAETDRQRKYALSWSGRKVILVFDRGQWAVAGDTSNKNATRLALIQAVIAGTSGNSPEKLLEMLLKHSVGDPSAAISAADAVRSAAAGLLAGPGSAQMVMLIILLALMVMVLRRRAGGPIFAEEWLVLAAVFCAVGAQFLCCGRVSADDWLFAPLYLAVPVWYGSTRGPIAGCVIGFATAILLLLGATCFAPAELAVDVVPVGEYLVLAVVLAGTAAVAGTFGATHPATVYLPLFWSLAAALLQRDLLLDVGHYATGGLGVLVLIGLMWRSMQAEEA